MQWSFGVTCWEVFAGGKVPYGGLSPLSVPELLINDDRLLKPQNLAYNVSFNLKLYKTVFFLL